MAKRQTLRSRVSLSLLKDDAQLNPEPETPVMAAQSPVATSRYTRLTRSTFKKVEDTPSQSSRCSNGAPATSPATEIQAGAEKTSSRGSQSVTGSQKRDHAGRWLPTTRSGKLSRKSVSNPESTREENSPVQQTKSPSTESERTKELLKSTPRKSTRISKQLKLDSPRSPISIEDVCPEHDGSQPEGNVDTNGGSHITEQSETRTPDLDTRVEEVFGVGKLDQDDVEMEKEEDKEGQSLCDISASFVLEPESLSVKISRSSTGRGRNSGKLRRKSVGNPESASVENSPVQQTKSPSTGSESTKELLKSTPRKSTRIVKQLKLDSPRSPISIEDVCPEHDGSQPEGNVDTNGGSHVTEQSETRTPDRDTRVEEELEVGKLVQDDVEMEKEEGKEEQSLCDISASYKLEPKSLPGEDPDQSSTQDGRDYAQTEDALDTEASPRANLADKQVQTVVWTIVASDVEESKNEEPEGEYQLVAEDLSPKKSQESAFGESPPLKQANGTLRDGTGLEAGQSEVDMEEDISAVCLKVDKETCEVMGKQELDKAATQEADEEVGGANDQAEDAATKPEQKVEEQNMKEREKTPKPAYHLTVSNLDTARDFAELQIAIISFFMVRKLLVTSIRMKKSRKRGYVTFLSRKDVNRALKYNGQQLLGRALRLRRPQKISKPMATLLTKKSKKELVSLLRKKKKKRQAQARKTEGASPLEREKERNQEIMASEKSEEDEQEDKMPLTKRKIAEILALSEEREGNSVSPPQKKKRRKKKKQQHLEMEGGLTEELVEEWSQIGSAVLLQKNQEELVLSQQGAEMEEEEEHAACPRKKKKRPLSSWCLCIQKVKSPAALTELKKVISDFLTGRSVAYKEIALYPDSCTACVELYGESDLDEALQFGLSKILGQTARLSKVEKLGALVDASDPRTLCVKNLPSEVRARDLKKLLEGVTGIWVQECQELKKRFAYVTLESEKATAKALTKSGVECKGVPIQLERTGQRRKEEGKILFMENLPYFLSKKYLRSVFPNAEAIRMCHDSQYQRITYVGYKTVREARVALKEFRERGFPGQVTRVASMEERKAKPESKLSSPEAIRSLFMWGMSNHTTVKTLKSTFKDAVDARISQLAYKRFAVVDFRTADEAVRAKEAMQHRTVDGHKLNIYFSKCKLGEQESVRSIHVT